MYPSPRLILPKTVSSEAVALERLAVRWLRLVVRLSSRLPVFSGPAEPSVVSSRASTRSAAWSVAVAWSTAGPFATCASAFMPRWVASSVLWRSVESCDTFNPLFKFSSSAFALLAALAAASAIPASTSPGIGWPAASSSSLIPGL